MYVYYVCVYVCLYVLVLTLPLYYEQVGRARYATNGSREVRILEPKLKLYGSTYIHTDIHIHIYVLKYRECLTIQFEWKEDCRLLNEEIGKWKRAYEVRHINICMRAYIHTYTELVIV